MISRANSLFNEEVYVYTPKGDMRILPKGATALDFAFSIHTDIGYHCTAIKVNEGIKPMGYKLKNGDKLTIYTDKNQKPNEGWLKLVTTGKARSKIRSAMKEERRRKGEMGKEALARKFKKLDIANVEEATEAIIKHYHYTSFADLYYDLAMEHLSIPAIFKKFQEENGKLILKEQPTPCCRTRSA